jgi:hypothetical protein
MYILEDDLISQRYDVGDTDDDIQNEVENIYNKLKIENYKTGIIWTKFSESEVKNYKIIEQIINKRLDYTNKDGIWMYSSASRESILDLYGPIVIEYDKCIAQIFEIINKTIECEYFILKSSKNNTCVNIYVGGDNSKRTYISNYKWININ